MKVLVHIKTHSSRLRMINSQDNAACPYFSVKKTYIFSVSVLCIETAQ